MHVLARTIRALGGSRVMQTMVGQAAAVVAVVEGGGGGKVGGGGMAEEAWRRSCGKIA